MRFAGVMTAVMLAGSLESAAAQRLLNWPVRTTALPDAVVVGAGALFWNPAGLDVIPGSRAEAIVVNLRTPSDLGLTGVAAGAVGRFEGTVIGFAYEHISAGSITETDNTTEALGELDLGEDHFTLAASRQVNSSLRAGATARYVRDNLDTTDPIVSFGAGIQIDMRTALSPRVAGYAITEADRFEWGGAAEVRLPAWAGSDYQLGAAYGLSDPGDGLLVHRATGIVGWKDQALVTAGLTREGGSDQASWQPTVAASLRITRYTLGVLRESLSNDLGATYSFRLQVGIGR